MNAIAVCADGDVGHVRREVERVATAIGFDAESVAELSIAAMELANNLVRHRAIEGEISVSALASENSMGIEILSRDRGPGIADIDLALKDHHSTNGTSGCGLGAVRRLMDEFEIHSNLPDGWDGRKGDTHGQSGTLVTTRKWVRCSSQPARFEYSAHSRPIPGETANGDSYFVREDHLGLLVAVVDGLGHGPEAASASQSAIAHIRLNKTKDFGDLLRELHQLLHGTRGVAITLLRICLPERRLIHSGIGNIDTRLYPRQRVSLLTRPGVLGMGPPPRRRVHEMPWPPGGTLVVFSDGLSPRWDLTEAPDLLQGKVMAIGHHLMRNHARLNDDATVVVAREVM